MLNVFNTLSGKKEEFIPLEKGKVKMYVCGITPYDYSHIGHARCYVTFDIIRRYLEFSGYSVKYVQNFTDIDDKIIKRANEKKEDPIKLANRFITEYFREFDELGVKRADVHPKVTEHITEIIAAIQRIIDNGYAYVSGGDVFFSVKKFKNYGKLSKQSLEDLIKGKRVEINENKKSPEDFALWKSAKDGEPSWDSPWGKGRPGWHIECSAMSAKYLGEQFDIHGGGQDLIFPHHENEIAQSESATGKHPFVKYWLHNGFVTVNKEKMAKSLGNFFTVKDALKSFDGETIRFFILSAHYRQPIDFSSGRLQQAGESLAKLQDVCERISEKTKNKTEEPSDAQLISIKKDFISAMNDDFNTPLAISILFKLRDYSFEKIEKDDADALKQALFLFRQFGSIFGISWKRARRTVSAPDSTSKPAAEKNTHQPTHSRQYLDFESMREISDAEIEKLVEERQKARKDKNFKRADDIRDGLKKKGIILEDEKAGKVRWRRTSGRG